MFKLWQGCVCAVFFTVAADAANIESHFDKASLAFEPNQGQWGSRTGFGVHGQGFAAGFSGRDVDFSLKGKSTASVRMRWQGGNGGVHFAPAEDLGGVSNYYRGSDSSKWISNVPHYRKLRVEGLYPGINLIYYGQGRELEYDLEVAPGADPRKARLQFDGANALRLDEHGDLVIETVAGNLIQHKPVAYQVSSGQRVSVAANYRLRGRNQVSIEVGQFDRTRPLVVDPTIAWGQSFGTTAFGGSATGVAVDGSGNVYLTGNTSSSDFPLVNPVDNMLGCPNFCSSDAFLLKLSPDGATVLFSTFLGGSAQDGSQAVTLDGAGNVYIAGYTYSTDFPTKSPYQSALKGEENVFVAKFTTSGTLTYATYLGGGGNDIAKAIAADSAGDVYLTGTTTSSNFPTVGPYQTTYGQSGDAFVTKVSPDGSALLFSTYLGGDGEDTGNALALGSGGTVYVAGVTSSPNFPTKNAFQGTIAPSSINSAFVTQFDATGATLVYSTFLGGSSATAYGLDVDATGAAYVVGTAGTGFPLKNSIQGPGDNGVAFITKLSPDGSTLVYSTYLGGNGNDTALAVKVNSSLNAIVVGITNSFDFPTLDALDPIFNDEDGFVAQLNATGSALVFSTYLGGSSTDDATAVALDLSGNIYVAGQTSSSDFPIQEQHSYGAPYVVKLSGGTTSIAATVSSVPPGLGVIVDGATVTTPRTFQWAPGVSHQLSAPSPIATAGPDVNIFTLWSNGGAETQSVMTPAVATNYTATYSTQACVYSFSPASQAVGQAGTYSNVTVNTQAGCPWTATRSSSWINGNFNGTGTGTIQYEVAANTGGGTRTGTINLGSATFTITQENMTPTVSYNLPCCNQSQSGLSQTFQIYFSDADGATDLSVSNILFNNFLDGRQACYLAFDHQANVLYLVGDSGGGLTGMSLSNGQGSGVISNSQCAVDGTKTSIIVEGTNATLTVGLDFFPSFGGNKVMYLAARDLEGNNSGWIPSATWGVPGPVVYPEVAAFSSNSFQTDTFSVSVTYRDATTNSNLSPVQLLINDYLNGANACYFGYDHTHNLLYLLNDAGSTLLPAITPGVGTSTQQNSQCVVYAQNSSVQQNGTDLTINLNLFFLPGFRGHRIVYAATQTVTNGNSGWQAIGALNIQ